MKSDCKNVLITGGTSGLGSQMVSDFLKEGYRVYSMSRNFPKQIKYEKKFDNVIYLLGDVSDVESIRKVKDFIEKEDGKLDVLINNAGIIHSGGVETLSYSNWDEMFKVNVYSVFNCVKEFLGLIKNSNKASIVNISSISSKIAGSSIGYSSCKASVDMMSKSMAKELSKFGIRVNSINPGLLDTGFQINNKLVRKDDYSAFLEKASEDYLLGVGNANKVSNLVKFLCSDEADWITGSSYIIDGGRSVNI